MSDAKTKRSRAGDPPRLVAAHWGLRAFVVLLAGAAVGACSADDADSEGGQFGDGGAQPPMSGDGDGLSGDADNPNVASGGSLGMGGMLGDDLPEELEAEESYQAPVAVGKYLWSANPESGRVALIDVSDLSVRVLSAGLAPTYLSAVPGSEDAPTALVQNVGSSDVTRFSVRKDGVRSDRVETHTGANRWAVSEHWAVAYSARERGEMLDLTEGLQEITVIALGDDEMEATRLTVGYRPSQLKIASDEEHLVVVSEEGITVIDLSEEPVPVAWVDLGFDAERRDVSLSDDGNYALVRRTDEVTMQVIDLEDTDQIVEVEFSGHITDLDLAPSGRGAAAIRSKKELATFRLEEILEDPTDFDTVTLEGELFGSVVLTETGDTAVLYTNAVGHELLNIVDLTKGDGYLQHRSLDTQAPVYSVTPTPDGAHAVVMAASEQGARSSAFSVVALKSERFPRVVGAQAPVSHVALSNDFGIVTAFAGSGVSEAYVIELPSLSVSSSKLSTEPLSAGVMGDRGVAFVAQAHPEGRVTFFDLAGGQPRTLTGFELSAEVVDR